jgi:hypothetical protein
MQDQNTPTVEQPETYGERIIRSKFNPSGSEDVRFIKESTAALIDKNRASLKAYLEKNTSPELDEQRKDAARWSALATTYYEMAAMFAVKVATAP